MSEQMINHVTNWEKANQEKHSESLTAELERYKERVKTFKQRLNIDLSSHEKLIDSQMVDMIQDRLALKQQNDVIPVTDEEETLMLEEILENVLFHNKNCLQNKLFGYKSDISPVKIEAPRELPKVSLVNKSLKKLKYRLGKFDTMVKKRMTLDAITEDLLDEITKVQTIINQMEPAVQQCFVDKQHFEIHKKELFLDNDQLLHQIMSQDVMLIVMNSTAVLDDSKSLEIKKSETCNQCLDLEAELVKRKNMTRALSKEHCESLIAQLNSKSMENADLKGQIQEKVFVTTTLQNELRRLKGKNVLDNSTTITNTTTIAPGMFKLDLEPLSPKLLKNRDAHINYLKYTQEQADILHGIVEQAKSKQPLDSALEFAYIKHSMLNANSELICATCNKCMFDAIHDICVLDFVKDVNVRSKSKSAKSNKKQNIWKPTSKVFTESGYRWKPTGRTFTLVGNSCTLTRITSIKVVHLKETTSKSVETQKPEIKVNSKKPKPIKYVGCLDCSLVSGLRMLQAYDREPLSAHQLCFKISGYYFDELTTMDSEQFSSRPRPHLMTPRTFNLGLVPNASSSTSYVPPTKNDWDILFQPMFDELLNPPPSVVSPVSAIAAQRPTNLTGSPVSTSIDQDAPSSSNPSTQEQEQSLIISQGVEESPKTTHFHDDLLHETLHEDSTSQGSSSNVWPSHTPLDLLG
ncbi:hypothetical protein Tco_0802408 [Tanacetum coccineum]|uniref:Uncharacterized protein n=1 Tax=Tanacetum coccineum TaxID=301880 RepID=A0ABQ5A2R0_9ASTR